MRRMRKNPPAEDVGGGGRCKGPGAGTKLVTWRNSGLVSVAAVDGAGAEKADGSAGA